ncbi:U1 small nuclear ribonucleoprotein C [Sarotherodon galilaeus]
MSVEYHASTHGIEESKIAYKQFFEEGSKFHSAVYTVRTSPFKLATVCLGLLCLLLLAGVIGQRIHYQNVERDYQNSSKAMSMENQNLQQNIKTVQKEKRDTQIGYDRLQEKYNYLSNSKERLQINYNSLMEEKQQLTESQAQLKDNNTALNQDLKKLTTLKNQLQLSNDALTIGKDLLQKNYDSVLKQRNDLQTSYDSVTKERNNLQNKFNNVTRSREQLQNSYNDLIKTVENLQDSYNFSTSEKDKLAKGHQNLTVQLEHLQSTYNVIKKAENVLRANYDSLVKEKNALQSNFQNVTSERDLLKVNNENLTAERVKLLEEINRLNATMQEKICPTGWKKFEYSCYFTSVSKKSWERSRADCQNRGADLAIIKSQEEMTFINGLYSSDKEVWIGLTDEGVEGQWKWVDGTPVTLTFWGKGQPNSYDGRNQDCVEFWHRASGIGDWNDENCNVEQNWICEM